MTKEATRADGGTSAPSSFASRKADREKREAVDGVTPRRPALLNRIDQSDEFTMGNVTVRRVQQ